MSSLLRFFGFQSDDEAPPEPSLSERENDAVHAILRSLEELPPERARLIACFAYVLGRVAHADLDISEEETAAMERIVVEHAHLPPEQAAIVVQVAKMQVRLFGATQNYVVTRELAELVDRQQARALLSCLFAVSAADEHVSGTEDAEIKRIANELRLERSDYLAARSAVKEHLGVLKGIPKRDDAPGGSGDDGAGGDGSSDGAGNDPEGKRSGGTSS